ncbi:MAG: hypothetical protein OXC06_15270 [Acidimicrobiaceae bacterium]|nr:hypothetical protein [Acidimicrobiaceae bacterium]
MGEQSIWRVLRGLVMPVYVPSVAGTLGIGLLLATAWLVVIVGETGGVPEPEP